MKKQGLDIVLIDDDFNSQRLIQELVENIPDAELIATAKNIKEGKEIVQRIKPDVVLLDVEMPDGTGFDLLNDLKQIHFHLIFVSSFEQYAIRAFKFSAIDYLVKPLKLQELQEALVKVKSRALPAYWQQQITALLDNVAHADNQTLVLNTHDEIHYVHVDDIVYLQSDGGYCHFFLEDNSKITLSKTLKHYTHILDSNSFIRIHKSFLVHKKFIKNYRKRSGKLTLKNGTELTVSQRIRDRIMQLL